MKRYIGPAAIVLAVVLAIVSLVVSGMTLYTLLRVRSSALNAVAEARQALTTLDEQTIETTIPLQQTFPIHAAVPLQEEFLVPIHTTIPISTVVQVPVQIPLFGTYEINVPVETDVPINLEVVIPISRTVPIDTQVVVDTVIPVRLELARLGLDDLLQQVDEMLEGVAQGLERFPFGR